jgi:trans-aconitate 2-methyltransferase
VTSDWDPQQYDRFARERSQPFHDLRALLRPRPGARVVDLGCGSGTLTALLHRELGAARTVGLDNSAAMLAGAGVLSGGGLTFGIRDIAEFAADPAEDRAWDVVFSNAALHWVPDHPTLLARLARKLADGGQLAVQVPANFGHPSHTIAAELAGEEPFRAAMAGHVRAPPVLKPTEYAELLFALGMSEQHVRLQVYGHVLEDAAAVVEWVKGTLLVDYRKRMSPELFAAFLDLYRARLLAALGNPRPYFYPFPRILLWARR